MCEVRLLIFKRLEPIMNNQILTEIEVNRKIYLFQKAVERYMAEKTIANSQAVAKAKNELCKFAMQVML